MKIKLNTLFLVCMFFVGLSNIVSQNIQNDLKEYCGQYGGNRVVGIENGKLFVQRNKGRKIVLEQGADGLFKSVPQQLPPLKFKRDKEGEITGFVMVFRNGLESELRPRVNK